MSILNTIIAGVAICVSIISFLITIWTWHRSRVISLRPILVFEYDGTKGWIIRNLGNGPALDITVAMKPQNGKWVSPVRIPPLSRGGQFLMEWLNHTNIHALGAIYRDIEERFYTSTCANDLSKVAIGRHLPVWPEEEIKRHWRVSAGQI